MKDTSGLNHCPLCNSADYHWIQESWSFYCDSCGYEVCSEGETDEDYVEYEDDWNACILCDGTGYVEEELGLCRDCGGLGYYP